MKLVNRRVVLTLIASACGGARLTPAVDIAQTPLPDAAIVDAGVDADDAWHGEGCVTIASRSATVTVEKLAISGRLYDGRTHCYLDLETPLCFQYPGDADAGPDAGLDRVDIRSLRIAGACGGADGEATFRGKINGPIERIRRRGWTVQVDAAGLRRVTRDVTIAETADKPKSPDDLKSHLSACWLDASSGSLALDLQVSDHGDVTDVTRRSGSGLSAELERCVIGVAREMAKFDAGSAGTTRRVALPITFARSLTPVH
jgi:hypothetical protein